MLLPALVACGAKTHSQPTIRAGNARFEFLTPSLVRMEYSPAGTFIDAPTAVVQKRDWPAVHVQSTQRQGWLIAASSVMTLRYRLQSGPFTATNLTVTWNDAAGAAHAWHPGDVDTLNLGGLTYSLDNISKANLPEGQMDLEIPVNDMIPGIDVLLGKAQPGLLSRAGYAFIDDSQTPVWNAQRTWIEPRQPHNGQDWYLFTYDRDYRKVLNEYAALCGPVPMIPRYVLGPWITDFNFEYFPGTVESQRPEFKRYDQRYLEEEVARLRQSRIPFDTLVLDFAWHNYGWQGGYDWSPLIPHPDELIEWLHGRGVKLGLNDHPGYANTDESILSFNDSHAPQVLKALGRPPPPQPSFDMDISKPWSFATDPRDQGLKHHWYATDHDAARWKPIRVMIGRIPVMLQALIARIGGKAPRLRDIHVERGLRGRRSAQGFQHLRCVAVVERQDALVGVGVTWMIVEAELDAPAMQPLDELIGVRNERAPVITALPSVVVPGEIQHQRIERNAALAQPCDLLLEVALIVALE